jgi:hypothetical protein
MAPKRRARDYTGALAEQIYLHRRETVDQVMARTVRKISATLLKISTPVLNHSTFGAGICAQSATCIRMK